MQKDSILIKNLLELWDIPLEAIWLPWMGTSGGLDQVVEGDKEISIEGQLGDFLNQSSHVDAVVDWYGPTNFMISCTED